jgi:hypothetical protein
MQRMTSWARPSGMIKLRRIRGAAAGLLGAVLLCAALAGCGAAAAAATSPQAMGSGGARQTPFPETGCASVNQATSATVTRYLVVPEPVNMGARTYTQHNAKKVRALFRDFCAVLAHAGRPEPGLTCAFQRGSSYAGTFYDGRRVLAAFAYTLRACPRLSLTAGGQTRTAFVIGRAAAAAPHLKADLAAVLGVPVSGV